MRGIFGGDISSDALKATYKRIVTQPDSPPDWSELFGVEPSLAAAASTDASSTLSGRDKAPTESKEGIVQYELSQNTVILCAVPFGALCTRVAKASSAPVEEQTNLKGEVQVFAINQRTIVGEAAGESSSISVSLL